MLRRAADRRAAIWCGFGIWRRKGHECRVVCAAAPGSRDVVEDGISIFPVNEFVRHSGVLGEHIREFQPDWVLVSSEDVSHVLLREAQEAAPGRLVYLAHTPQFFPFGPASWNADASASGIVRGACAVVAIGRHMAAYIERHLGRPRRLCIHRFTDASRIRDTADFSAGRC